MFSRFKILQWNARGLRTNGPELLNFLTSLSYNPEIICIQESWLREDLPFEIPDYFAIYQNRLQNLRGGCAIYVHNSVHFEIISVPAESEFQKVKLTIQNCSCFIVNFYHCGGLLQRKTLDSLLENISGKFVICGDFNSHNPIWGSNRLDQNGRIVEDFMSDNNIVYLNNGEPTRLDPGYGTLSCLDLTLVSSSLAPKCDWQVLNDKLGSDHFPIITTVNFNGDSVPQTEHLQNPTPNWSFYKANWDKYSRETSKISFNIADDNVQTFYTNFISFIKNAADASIPKSKGKKTKPPNPWWNADCESAIRSRNRAKRKFIKSLQIDDLIEYKKLKSIAQRTIRQAKHLHWVNFCNKLNRLSPISYVWRKIRSITNSEVSANKNKPIFLNDQIITNNSEKANVLADYFSISMGTADCTPADKIPEVHSFKKGESCGSLNEPFTMEELSCAIESSNSSTPGQDGISKPLITNMHSKAKCILLDLFNLIWNTSTLPKSWHHAIVVPIPKVSQNKRGPESYRPVSLTCTLCKIMERMITKRLVWFLEKYNVISPHQAGFQKNRSVLDHIVRLDTDIKKSLVQKNYTVAIFLDFEKAFDTVWHEALLKKLQAIGISGNFLRWVETFLKDRSFQVRVENTLSQTKYTKRGVPQGSVISPILFNIFINDLADICSNSKVSLYADDVALWKNGSNLKFVSSKIQNDLLHIEEWSKKWKIKLSESKSKVVVFTNKPDIGEVKLTLNGKTLEVVKKFKFLGVVFDKTNSWRDHIQKIETSCTKRTNILKCITGTTWGADTKTLLLLYRALIRPVLDYACEVYTSASKTLLVKINSIQYQCLKICTGAPARTSLEALLVLCGEPPLEIRRQKLSDAYKIRLANSKPSHPTKECLLDCWQYQTSRWQGGKEPFALRTAEIQEVESVSISPVPPWHLNVPPIHFKIHKICTKNDQPEHLKQVSLEFLNSHFHYDLRIFTDGSKDPVTNRTSAAFWIPKLKVSESARISNISVCRAEQVAIILALTWLQSYRPRSAVICSDSLSTLQMLQNSQNDRQNLILEILLQIQDLNHNGTNISFVWIPSHCGINGNEMADNLAKLALKKSGVDVTVKPNRSETFSLLKHNYTNKWQERWQSSNQGRFLFQFMTAVSPAISFNLPNRRDEIVYHRLLLGKVRLNSYLKTIGKHPTGLCSTCNQPETVEHFLIFCPLWAREREQLKTRLKINAVTLKQVLTLNSEQAKFVLQFVKQTGLYFDL